jgi:hypothetical protein
LALSTTRLAFGPRSVQKASDPQEVRLTNESSDPFYVELVTELRGEFQIVANQPPDEQHSPRVLLQPRESWRLAVVFTPTSPGEKSGRLLFKRLDVAVEGVVELSGSGRTERGGLLQVQPLYLQFDPRLVGSVSDWKTVALANRGDAPLVIRKVEIRGDQAGDFLRSDDPIPEALGVGERRELRLRFAPRAPGSRSAELALDEGAGKLHRVPLAGTGRAAQNYRLWDLAPGAGSFSYARAVSAAGQMVGVATDAENRHHAALWEGRSRAGLPKVLTENASGAEGVSDDGKQVAGWLEIPGSGGQHAFCWDWQSKPQEYSEDDHRRLKDQLRDLDDRERATIEAQIAGVRVGARPEAYTAILEEIARKREALVNRIDEMEDRRARSEGTKTEGATEALGKVLADVDEALTAPEITAAEKHDLLARVITSIFPEGDGFRIDLLPLREGDQTVANVSMFWPPAVGRAGLLRAECGQAAPGRGKVGTGDGRLSPPRS